MKKTLILLLGVGVVVLGFYIFKSNISLAPEESNQPKFFGQNKILPTDTVVKIKETGFEPAEINIKRGMRVVWASEAPGYSWPASDPHPSHTNYPGFDPGEPLKTGEAWSFTFDKVGGWEYHNHLNPSHRGKIVVKD